MIYLDTNILIYLLESREQARFIAQTLTDADQSVITSTLTITEFLSGVDDSSAKEALYGVSTLSFIGVDVSVAEHAAELQKKHGLKIGDAIHLASAIEAMSKSFFTNDMKLARTAKQYLDVITLD